MSVVARPSGTSSMNELPVPGRARHRQLAAHQAGEAPRDRQSKAGAAKPPRDAVVGLDEILENPLVHVGRDADAGIANGDAQQDVIVLSLRGRAQVDAAAW